MPQVAVDSLIADLNGQLATLELEMTRLQEKFKPAHPEVQKVQAQIEQIRKAKDARAAQIVGGLQAEFSAAPEARGGAEGRHRRAEGPGRVAEPQGRPSWTR